MTTQTRSLTPYEVVKQHLQSEQVKAEFKMALPPQMPVDRFIRVAITAINQNEDLVNADRQSLYRSLMKSAQDGLLPDGQEAAIVMFGNQAQYMPMTKGLLKKIRNSGELASIAVEIVYEADTFRYWTDEDGVHLNHEPFLDGDRGKERGVYALAKTKDGAIYFEYMTRAEVEKVRSISRASTNPKGPWVNWWDQMAKKTAIRRLSKRLPMSTDLDDLIRRDDELYDVESKVSDGKTKPEGEKGKPGRLQSLLRESGPTIEGEGREVEEPTVIIDPEDAAKIKARQAELDKQKEQLKGKGSAAPSDEEQAAIAKREAWEAAAFKCVKCDKYAFSTDSKDEYDVHMQTKHPQAPAQQKKTNGGGKGAPAGEGDIFGSPK